ncbi:MAG: FMN-binding protein [Planctomycetes bacterium]|nr:FMN-binding protein [Planctomycetota bacterium]
MKEKIKMIVFILVLGSVLTAALVSVDAFTAPYIKANTRKKLQESILKAADIAFTEETLEEVFSKEMEERLFPESLQVKGAGQEDKKKFYVTKAGDYIFEYRGSGLQDEIYGAIAFKPDLKTIKGVTIVSQKETPGLGGRIGTQDFLDRFRGRKIFPELRITKAGKAKGENEVDGLTGATLSCNAFEELLNSESHKYIKAINESIK